MVVVRNPRAASAVDAAALRWALDEAGISADVVDTPDTPAFEEWIDALAMAVTCCPASP